MKLISSIHNSIRGVSAAIVFLAASGCATGGAPSEPVVESGTPPFASAPAESASQPLVINLGNSGLFVSTAQSANLRTVMLPPAGLTYENGVPKCDLFVDQDMQARCINYRNMNQQLGRYGRFYRRLVVDLRDGNWLPAADEAGKAKGVLSVDCAKTKQGPIAQFLGSLIGFKRGRTSVLTVTVSATEAAANDDSSTNDFVSSYPILGVSRNKDQKGKCEYELKNATKLTPLLFPASNDELFVKLEVRYTDKTEVNLSTVFGLVETIGAAATPSAGFTKTIAGIAADEINTKLNDYFDKNWSRDVNLKMTQGLKLNANINDPYDKIVLSLSRPSGEESFETLKFAAGPAITMRWEYVPTLFIECGGELWLGACPTFDTPDQVLDKIFANEPQSESLRVIADSRPSVGDGDSQTLTQRLRATVGMPTDQAFAELKAVCADARSQTRFAPYGAMNKIDQLMFFHAWINKIQTDFASEYPLTKACFSETQVADLISLGPTERPEYGFPAAPPSLAIEALAKKFVLSVAAQLVGGTEGKTIAFGDEAGLEIAMSKMLDGIERNPAPDGAEAAAALEEVKFKAGSVTCGEPGIEPTTGNPTYELVGFLHKVDDRAASGKGIFYAPFVIELADDAEPQKNKVRLKSMYIAGSAHQYFERMNLGPAPANAWSSCPVRPEDKDALEAMRSEMELD